MLWIHGGGLVIGTPAIDDAANRLFAEKLGITVVAPAYRLAPEHPYPAALDDLWDALQRVKQLGQPIVVAGASAGGGLAAALCLRARERGDASIRFQLLIYPMLDDRTTQQSFDERNMRLWNNAANRFGWESYLGKRTELPAEAVPARAASLAGLPPAWIGVGTNDLFHDEDVAYAGRLRAAGVNTELEVVPGAFHGFDIFTGAPVVKAFRAQQLRALDQVFSH
jgi:acetyl esterase/lipase